MAALERAGPAAAVALDRPSWALEAALEAASEVEEACRTKVRRVRNCDCRRTARVAAGILGECEEKEEGVDAKRDQAQITRDDRWWEGDDCVSPMAVFVLRNDRTRICGFGGSESSGNEGHVIFSSAVPESQVNNCHCKSRTRNLEIV